MGAILNPVIKSHNWPRLGVLDADQDDLVRGKVKSRPYSQDSRKEKEPRTQGATDSNQRSNCQHLLDHRKSKRIPENIYFCFIDLTEAFDCVDQNTLWTILKETGTADHLTCLLRNCMQVKRQ